MNWRMMCHLGSSSNLITHLLLVKLNSEEEVGESGKEGKGEWNLVNTDPSHNKSYEIIRSFIQQMIENITLKDDKLVKLH